MESKCNDKLLGRMDGSGGGSVNIRSFLVERKTFGLHQIIQWCLISLCNIITALHLVASVFISAAVSHRCAIPGLESDSYNSQNESLVSLYIPKDEQGEQFQSCKMYKVPQNETQISNTSSKLVDCENFVYDTSQFTMTTTSQFDLVCNQQLLSTLAGVIYMSGLFVGSLIFGSLSDFLGRKWTVYIGLVLQGGVALGIMFSQSFVVFTILRFLLGAVSIGGLIAQFILIIEQCPASYRTLGAIAQTLSWCIGVMLLSLFAYYIRDWRTLQLALACLSGPYILTYWWFLDESPAWLLAKGRFDDAIKIVKKIKRMNKLEDLDIDSLYDPGDDETTAKAGEKWRTVFTSKILILNILINCFGWFVSSLGYYGLALNVGNLVGDLYLNNFIGGLVEVPAYILLLICMKVGRKWPYVILMAIGGAALITSAFLIVYIQGKGYDWAIVAVSMVGKFSVSAGFELIYFWSAEMYPTSLRNSMLGLNSASARVGGMVAPVIADIPKYNKSAFAKGISPLVFGVLMILTALSAIALPETNNVKIPETAKEANRLKWNFRDDSRTSVDGASHVKMVTDTNGSKGDVEMEKY